jgi:hypothetical protein
MACSFPPVPSHNPGVISKPNAQSLGSTVPDRDGSNALSLYQNKLLLLVDEKMDKRFWKTGLLEAKDPWPLLRTLEERYESELPTYPSFLALQQNLLITEGATPQFSGCRADAIITSYMISVVDSVLSLQSGYTGSITSERAKLPPGLCDKTIEYNKIVCKGQHKLVTDILHRLHWLFQQTLGIRTEHFCRGYFLKCIFGQMEHSISQHVREQRCQEEELRRQEEERERKRQEEEHRQGIKDKKVRECHVAIVKGHFGTLQTNLHLPDIGNDTIVLDELIRAAEVECDVVEISRNERNNPQAQKILHYLHETLRFAKSSKG